MHLIVLSGPTASGKTRFAIQLAQHYNTVIVSADSRQFYREMTIGTAKPNAEELAAAKHFFIDSHSVATPCSVGQYETEALQLLQELSEKYELAILTGGSGLYLKAVCEGLDPFPQVPEPVRSSVEADYQKHGLPFLQQELQQSDPAYYEQVDLANPHRLIRALSVCRSSGLPFSSFRQRAAAQRPFTPIYIQLQWPRAALYGRIDRRAGLMLERSLLEEARSLLPLRHLTALQTVGYQELFDHLEGKTTLEEAAELIKRNSRRYAKRQLTWFRRDGFWKLFRATELTGAISYIDQSIRLGLSWKQERDGDTTNTELRSKVRPVATFARTLRKGQSLALLYQPPEGQLAPILWHQLQLLTVDDEAAFVATPASSQVPGWPNAQPAALPGWAKRAVESHPDWLIYRIPN